MRRVAIVLIVGLAACNNSQESPASIEPVPDSATSVVSDKPSPSSLESSYSLKTFDTLHVFAPKADQTGEYKGIALDSSLIKLIPLDQTEQERPHGFFAVYRFPLTNQLSGLVTRTPGWFYSSEIDLLQYHPQSRAVAGRINLADRWGDGGDFERKDAWIFKTDGQYQALVWTFSSHDQSVDNPSGKGLRNTERYCLLSLSMQGGDTLSKDSAKLAARFSHLTNGLRDTQ